MKRIYKFKLDIDCVLKGTQIVEPKCSIHRYGDRAGKIWLELGPQRLIRVKRGYAWDGASPKFKIFGKIIGTPDTKNNKTATCVHDALYQFKHCEDFPYTRKQIDELFYLIMKAHHFKFAWLYYIAVRLFGGIAHKADKNAKLKEIDLVI